MKKDVFHFISKDGGIFFSTDFNKRRFLQHLKDHPGLEYTVAPNVPAGGSQLRKFFEGPVIEFFRLQHRINGAVMDRIEARKTLKREFNPVYVRRLDGTLEIEGGETREMRKDELYEFVQKILRYMEEQGYKVPDPVDFENWKKSAPMVGEEYPPLARLRAEAEKSDNYSHGTEE